MVYYRDKKTIVIMAVIMQLWVMISCVVVIVLNWIPPNRATTTEIKPEIHAPTEKRWAPQDSIRSHVPAIAQRLGLRTELLVDSTIVEINNDKRGAKSNYQQRCVVGRAYTIFSASEDFYVWDTIRINSRPVLVTGPPSIIMTVLCCENPRYSNISSLYPGSHHHEVDTHLQNHRCTVLFSPNDTDIPLLMLMCFQDRRTWSLQIAWARPEGGAHWCWRHTGMRVKKQIHTHPMLTDVWHALWLSSS